ncbi:MAG: DsbA family protein [Alphaproteobacteria bacterium CG_4_10_14_0_2_um_filter_63_37]|nr:MAG: hypothetical protein AUJ55_12055 [Proteobacteria bacterium CG1_02_64_396]PJA25703.1 MAG: DsbA family protein [Alphaproteobacteria bacterium CG_4_10_14_0_2_um_filter_63_37]
MNALPPVRATVFYDVICPFCYIGDRRLGQMHDYFDLSVDWRPIEIHPDTPEAGRAVADLGYPLEQLQAMQAHLARMGREEGIDLMQLERVSNSHRALLLLEAARDEGEGFFAALQEILFHAFFTLGRDIGDPAVLKTLAAQAGLPLETVELAWNDPIYEERLAENQQWAKKIGVRGTPTVIFNDHLAVAGAVPLKTLMQAAAEALGQTAN